MSRIGEAPIEVVSGVTVEKTGKTVNVKGPKGVLSIELDSAISIEVKSSEQSSSLSKILVKRKGDEKRVKAMHGLTRNLIANMVTGVSTGWSKNLELVGVGFRAQGAGNKITMNLGFSHPVEVEAPEGITFEVSDNTKIKVLGIDKQVVGQVAANIRKVKEPDVYKGKGIRYQGEYIRKKLGKSGKVGATGAGGAK